MLQQRKDKYRGIKIVGMAIVTVLVGAWTINEYNYRTATPEQRERIHVERALAAAERARDAKAREDRAKEIEAQKRHHGDHCRTDSYVAVRMMIERSLHDPGSLDVLNWAMSPRNTETNSHRMIVEFTAKNAFGGRVRSIASTYVSHETCNPVAPLSIRNRL